MIITSESQGAASEKGFVRCKYILIKVMYINKLINYKDVILSIAEGYIDYSRNQ